MIMDDAINSRMGAFKSANKAVRNVTRLNDVNAAELCLEILAQFLDQPDVVSPYACMK